MKKPLIAVVQMEAIQLKPEKALKKIEEFVKKAVEKKANVIIFPEDCIEGIIVHNKEFADSTNKNKIFFINLAKRYKIDIITGSFIEKTCEKLENVSYYIDFRGKVKARYVKINLWHPERGYISPGDKIYVFNTRYGKSAIIICWDLASPKIFEELLKKRVKIIYCPSYWTFEDAGKGMKWDKNSDKQLTSTLCATRAFEANSAIIYCNAAGNLKLKNWKGKLLGNSQIVLPFKGAIKKLDHNKEEMFIQKLDLKLLKDSEQNYKLLKDYKEKYIRIK